jgi:hypothetical protein
VSLSKCPLIQVKTLTFPTVAYSAMVKLTMEIQEKGMTKFSLYGKPSSLKIVILYYKIYNDIGIRKL